MPRLNPLRKLYVSLNSKLDPAEVKKLKDLLEPDQLQKNEVEQLNDATDIFRKLEDKGLISLDDLELLKELFSEIQRPPLVEEVDEFLRDNRPSRPESQSTDATSSVQTTDSPQLKRRKYFDDAQYPTEIPEPKYPDVVLRCEEKLRLHNNNLSKILPLPWWDGNNRLKLENIYTELELHTKDGKKRDFARQEIFSSQNDGQAQKRVLIEGDPGYGKSTFCKKLAYDWAKGNAEYLNYFKFIFCFELRDLLEYDESKSIEDIIFDHFSFDDWRDGEKQQLWNFIRSNQKKVCFVFDGLDEVPTEDLPAYLKKMVQQKTRLLSDCLIIITSRKIRDPNSKEMYDTQLVIKGFDRLKAMLFIEKHIKEMNLTGELETEAKPSIFLEELETSSHKSLLFDFMQSPLNTLMLCDIWIHTRKLPHTVTKLYEEITDYVVKRYKDLKNGDSEFDVEIEKAVLSLGEMSYNVLTTRESKVYFTEEDISCNRYIRELGFLTKVSGFPSKYSFYHLTFHEYFASKYVVDLLKADRSKFVDVIYFSSRRAYVRNNETLLSFIGGGLQGNVGEIFKAWEEKWFSPSHRFDPRPIVYESCSQSTEVFENCARFLPKELKVDFNTMVCHPDSNRLKVNAAVLKYSHTRSEKLEFILPASNADAVAMYKKCREALQENANTFKHIKMTITFDLNEYNSKGGGCAEKLKFITKTLGFVDVKFTGFNGLNKDYICLYTSTVVKALSRMSADWLRIEGLPLGNIDFMKGAFGYLSSNKLLKSVDITFCDDFYQNFDRPGKLNIKAKFGKIETLYKMITVDYKSVDLHNLLSTFAFVDEKVSLYISVDSECDFGETTESDLTDVLHILESVDIKGLSFSVTGSGCFNKGENYLHIFTIVKRLSMLSADDLSINRLPFENLELMNDVLDCVYSNDSLKSATFSFYGDGLFNERGGKVSTAATFGKCTTQFSLNTVDKETVDLLNLFSAFASVGCNEGSLDIDYNCDLKDTTNTLHKLKTVDIVSLSLKIRGSGKLCEEDMYSDISAMVKALSETSVRDLKITGFPVGSLQLVRNVLDHLSRSEFLASVDLIFNDRFSPDVSDDFYEYMYTVKIYTGFGKLSILYGMYAMDFELADLHNLLSIFASACNKTISFSVDLNYDLGQNIEREIAILRRLESVDIIHLKLHLFINSYEEDMYSQVLTIANTLSRVSANTLEIRGLPVGQVDFMRDVLCCLISNKLLKSVDVRFVDEIMCFDDAGTVNIETTIGTLQCCFAMFTMEFELVDLHDSLSTIASDHNESVSLDVDICYDFENDKDSNITDMLSRLASVDIGSLSISLSCSDISNKQGFYSHVSAFVKEFVRLSGNRCEILGLPLGNFEFMTDVLDYIISNTQSNSVDITFRSEDCGHGWSSDKVKIQGNFGKFKTCYRMNTMDFELETLHNILSKCATVLNDRLSLDVKIGYNLQREIQSGITDVFCKLEAVTISLLAIEIDCSRNLNEEDICSCTSTIIQGLSRVSANKLDIKGLPPGNSEFVRRVLGHLSANGQLKYVDVTFCDDWRYNGRTCILNITATCGKIRASYKIDNMIFVILELHNLLSTFASLDKDRACFDFEINYDMESDIKFVLPDVLRKLESVNIGQLTLNVTGTSGFNNEDIFFFTTAIAQELSKVSANKLEIRGLSL